ncbi:TonB-dependent receptor [Hyphomonas sp.]|jgi:outer membrane receptor protein involved in Fe transport|uniref:TonB-dependent receptor n=4 Tax=Hyphomonas TaxID=85 RepID=UPI0025C2CA64|nr:TonB-dependent receptor [Hyphomonas sp.]|tara:strand:- start:963 stop:3695 length:2733 start_codon:yes stop_codon:yes gene_type:complete
MKVNGSGSARGFANKLMVTTAMTLGVSFIVAAAASGQEVDAVPASQEEVATQEKVVVTGSRIQRSDLTSVGPLAVLDEQEIYATGITNVEELLQTQSFSAGFAGNANAAYWVSGGWGTAQVNLRGLGPNRTLVLLNGRRVVAGGSGANSSVDLNMIPVSLLERVEVLKDGASAVYGADAVSGVVNLITKDEFDGFRLDTKFGISDEGDAEEYLVNMTWGVTNDRGSLMFNASYQNNLAAPLDVRAPCALADLDGDGDLECTSGSSSTAGGRAVLPNGDQINFIGGDAYEPFSLAAHGFNSNPFFNASNPVERVSFAAIGKYDLNDSTRFFSEALFNWRTSNQPGSPATLSNISFDASHPTNPTGEDIILLRRRTAEFGSRQFEQDVSTWRLVAGVEGDLWDGWNYDLSLNWGRNTAVDALKNNINTRRLAETLDPTLCGMNGIPCADILGEGDLTSEVGDYILINQRDTGGNEQISFTGNISGALFDLPAGPVGFAAGFEYREDKGWLEPDSLLVAGDALGNAQDPVSGSIEAQELYAEVNVPLVRDLPLAQAVDLDLAVRYSDYDLFGSDENYKVGINWQLVQDFKLRGTYSTAFRVPSVTELFSGVSEGQIPTADPCSNWATMDPSSAVYQNCQAAGVPVGYTQLGSAILTDQGGNPNLEPEDAATFTVGAVYQPSFVPGLSITLDYFDIDIQDAIRQTSGSTKLASCYTSVGLSHPFCGPTHHTRNALTGDIDFLSAQSANTGDEVMQGIDISASYDFATGNIKHSVEVQATHLMKYEVTAFDGDTPFVYDGGVGCCDGGYPSWRATGSWSASSGPWHGTYNAQLIGSATDYYGAPGAIGTDIDAVLYHNVQGGYQLTENLKLSAGVDNLFDKKAPYVRSWSDGNTDTMTYSLLGRYFYARATWVLD